MAVETRTESRLVTSLGNFYSKRTLYTTFWDMDRITRFAHVAGYQGVEVHPFTRIFAAGRQLKDGKMLPFTKEMITSAHQSFRTSRNPKTVLADQYVALGLASFFALPHRHDSLEDIKRLQVLLGRELPTVVYPEIDGEQPKAFFDFASASAQPTLELMERFDTPTIGELVRRFEADEIGICLDTHHSLGTLIVNSCLEHGLDEIYQYMDELHISVVRTDHPKNFIDTIEAGKDLIYDKSDTVLPKMLRRIGQSGWKGLICIEAPAFGLQTLENRALTPNRLAEYHRRMVDTTANLLGL